MKLHRSCIVIDVNCFDISMKEKLANKNKEKMNLKSYKHSKNLHRLRYSVGVIFICMYLEKRESIKNHKNKNKQQIIQTHRKVTPIAI